MKRDHVNVGQQREPDVRLSPKADKQTIASLCPLSADFVAEIRCKLFWSVIPSL